LEKSWAKQSRKKLLVVAILWQVAIVLPGDFFARMAPYAAGIHTSVVIRAAAFVFN